MRLKVLHAISPCAIFLAALGAWAQPAATRSPASVAVKVAPRPATDDFYIPLPPRFVAGPMVSMALWSPDGRYVSAVTEDFDLRAFPVEGDEPPHTISVVIWNASTHRSVTVWSDTSARISQIAWLPGSSIAFVCARWNPADEMPQSGVWRIDARRSGATKVDGFNLDDMLFISPSQPFAFVFGSQGGTSYLKPLAAHGTIGAPIPLASPAAIPAGWTQDGRRLIIPPPPRPAPKDSNSDVARLPWQVFDARSGRFTTVDKPPVLYEAPARAFPFRVASEPCNPAGKASPLTMPWGGEGVRQAWIEQGKDPAIERFFLAADTERTEVAPRRDAILYVNREGAFVVPLLKVPRAVLDAARNAAQKSKLLNNGKQIAMAVIMWAMDHGDSLPPQGDGLKDTLTPYLKNDAVFQGFVYTLNGGTMKDIKNPATTVMGYLAGPGGFAVVYADGHVQWETKLPSAEPANQ